jgi:hypothetical protein
MSFVEFGNCVQFKEMIMGPQSSTTTYDFIVPGNEIPNWFNHQSLGSSISFWVGPVFPNFALCLVFGSKDDSFDCYVNISINGRKQNFTSIHFFELRYDHLWFYWRQDSIQRLFKDLNLGDRNHVELFCKTIRFCKTTSSTSVLRNMIKRIGVHVECICPQITKTIFQRQRCLKPSLLRGPTCISHTLNHNLCPTQTTSRQLLLKLKPRKLISKRNWALPRRSSIYVYGTQACSHCPNYLGCMYSPESTSGFDLGSSPLAHPSLNHDSNFNLYSLWKILGTFLMKICQGIIFCCFVLFACLCVFVSCFPLSLNYLNYLRENQNWGLRKPMDEKFLTLKKILWNWIIVIKKMGFCLRCLP